jgi:hypothetical protein
MARIKLERTDERLTRRTGLILVNRFGDKIHLRSKIDHAFRAPGSNRGFQASEYILALAEMFIDGATCLEDIRLFRDDRAYQELAEIHRYPTSDAIGDWLRRNGGPDGERRLGSVMTDMIQSLTTGGNLTLDIDTTLIESDKGDAVYTYKGFRGYNPLLGGSTELGLIVGSRFQPGNSSPQSNLASFIDQCCKSLPGRFTTVRSDSAGYNREVVNYCLDNQLFFSITADHDTAVMNMIHSLPESEWIAGVSADGTPAPYHVAEFVHRFEHYRNESFRLVAKRSERHTNEQQDLFDGKFHYWIIATNLPHNQYDTQAIIHFQNGRGEFEKMIGEIKVHYGLSHMPLRQMDANTLYFSIGLLAFNLVQLLKQHFFGDDWKQRSVKSLRYYWFNLPSRTICHAGYRIVKIATNVVTFNTFYQIFARLTWGPLPAPA